MPGIEQKESAVRSSRTNVRSAALAIFVVVLLASANGFAAPPAISWEPARLEQTLGNALGATRDTPLILVSAKDLSNVDIWITPEIRPFLQIEPAHLDAVEAGVTYELRAHWSIPPRAAEGAYEGTVHLRSGKRTLPRNLKVAVTIDYDDILIPATTHVLSALEGAQLTAVTPTA
jgi:hypothetical protein